MGIVLSKRKLTKGRFSLYLDCNIQGRRHKESLGIILEAPTSKELREANRAKLQLARLLRSQRELDCIHSHYWSKIPPMYQPQSELRPVHTLDFFQVLKAYIKNYQRKDIRMVQAVLVYLRRFHAPPLPMPDITRGFCSGFFYFLQGKLRGDTPVSYFKKFKMCLDYCVEENLLPSNPAKGIRMAQSNDVTKEILSAKELIKLTLTPCHHPEVKRAFLFSCQSGLRWCDIYELRYKNIDFSQKRLTLVQKKVAGHSGKSVLHLHLNENALRLLSERQGNPKERVFQLPSHSYCLRMLKAWSVRAGIRKHISYHCARHTFITSIMARGANIKTAASLAGHSSTRHTEKYVHILDTQKQKAVDSLPSLPL